MRHRVRATSDAPAGLAIVLTGATPTEYHAKVRCRTRLIDRWRSGVIAVGAFVMTAGIAVPVRAQSPPPGEGSRDPAATPSPAPEPSPSSEPNASPSPPPDTARVTPVSESASSAPPPDTSSSSPSRAPTAVTTASARRDAEFAVIGSTENALARIPGAATVVTERDFARAQPFTLGEMLRRVPGLYVREEDLVGLRLNVGIRGFDPTRSRYVQMLEDGIPIALGPYGESDTVYVPPLERVQRIEVVRGSGNVLFGPTSTGGTINFVTAAPPAHELISASVLAGDHTTLAAHATYGNTFGNTGILVSLTRRQGDGFRHFSTNPWEVTDVLAKVRIQLGPRSELVARVGIYNEGANLSALGLTSPMFAAYTGSSAVSDPAQNPTPFDWFRLQRYSAALIHEFRITDNIRLHTTLYGYLTDRAHYQQLYDRAPVPMLAYASIAGDPTIAGGALYLRDANHTDAQEYIVVGLEPRLQAGFRVAGFRNELDLGGRVVGEQTHASSLLGNTQYARSGMLVHDEFRQGVGASAWVQDRFFFTDQLQLTPSVRVESYSFNRLVRRDNGVDMSLLANASAPVTVIPGVAAAFSTSVLTAFADVHLGYTPVRSVQALDPMQPAQTLNPEQSINYEIGARAALAEWLRAELAGFYIDFQNAVTVGPLTGVPGVTGLINGAPRRFAGAEALATLDFGRLAHLDSSIRLSVRYTFVDARYAAGPFAGNFVPYAPAHTFVASAGFEHPIGIAAQVSWMFVSEQYGDAANTVAPSADGRVGLVPFYNAADITASYTHRPTGLGIALSAKNLFDSPYVASRSPDGIVPAGFRQLMLIVRWTP